VIRDGLDDQSEAAVRRGARLILLNGMPGIGKSTLAARYVADHPGVLLLDIDRIRQLIGGDWSDNAGAARVLGLAMATAHLATGHDVVVPQLVARVDQLERFEAAAVEAGASFVNVMLAGDVGRGTGARASEQELAAYASGLVTVTEARPHMQSLPVRSGELDATYADLTALLGKS
jgi:hypothetical protein